VEVAHVIKPYVISPTMDIISPLLIVPVSYVAVSPFTELGVGVNTIEAVGSEVKTLQSTGESSQTGGTNSVIEGVWNISKSMTTVVVEVLISPVALNTN